MSGQVIHARDVMQKEVLSIDGMASAKEAAARMRSANAAELLVAKRNEDDAWGIVTIMDLIQNVIAPGRDAENVFVYEIMTKPVITVSAQMDIRYVIRLMQRINVRRAPVVDKDEIVGMFTLSSLVLDHEIL
ncbi:MAG: CBS domain-containing protein [Candidatus Magnetoglobus multicellularis str. Araruama]|uniref:CBS domain-containing protein n=1 Tax=Candidatus Magnetoglobus multicellularis str. Araruama TaxID=890399 RepID=A0A1V1P8D0_9BACT|nr:MAG: CBS domain-containing protein [Candidatus Magnetoglobus multicellularis str. Araruama]